MKGQTAIEFVVLATVMLFFFSLTFIYVQKVLADSVTDIEYAEMEAIQAAVVKEIALADRMPSGYMRTFSLPQFINGKPYTILLQPSVAPVKDAVTVTFQGTSLVQFLQPDVSGSLVPGVNTINKTANIILN